ncbi:polymerase epsilon subunit 2 [Seminavis robusta]|uniref:DNA polymerase epsilon subunit n=1 Tax=Seminavis robusta TaxID=568900 RepID=A0A9N8ESP9_9STRA|nr:polymerase epsilon subunit 2 [Seminavis robusta]|eukprot:Sro1993_g309900.1 polymerase epsilon subunit 2 (532) ;mRNA; r:6601-8292
MPTKVSRRQLIRACKGRGWMVQGPALVAMHEFFNLQDSVALDTVLDALAKRLDRSTTVVTESLWNGLMEETDETDDAVPLDNDRSSSDVLQVVNAFDGPKLVYDTTRRAFRIDEKPISLLGSAQDKIKMMAQRYAFVHQRLLRHQAKKEFQLTPIESLLGRQSTGHEEPVLVMGILTQASEGKFKLEDSTGEVEVSFHNATLVESCFVTENSILLVEGTFVNGSDILEAHRVGSPPFLEERESCLNLLKKQVRHAHFQPSTTNNDFSLVVLSDVHLDQPSVLASLENLFQTVQEKHDQSTDEPLVFCLMGNFASSPYADNQQGWQDLAKLIEKFKFLANQAHFVVVPGPNDTTISILPLTPISYESTVPAKSMQSIRNVHWGSNPCRLRLEGKEIVLFNYDVLSSMLQNAIQLPEENSITTPRSRMLKTILDQGHLLPVAKSPIYWNCDHALRIWPPPDMIVLGGSSAAPESQLYAGCDAVHLGSFSRKGSCSYYTPRPEFNDDDDHELEDGTSRFEFLEALPAELKAKKM